MGGSDVASFGGGGNLFLPDGASWAFNRDCVGQEGDWGELVWLLIMKNEGQDSCLQFAFQVV